MRAMHEMQVTDSPRRVTSSPRDFGADRLRDIAATIEVIRLFPHSSWAVRYIQPMPRGVGRSCPKIDIFMDMTPQRGCVRAPLMRLKTASPRAVQPGPRIQLPTRPSSVAITLPITPVRRKQNATTYSQAMYVKATPIEP